MNQILFVLLVFVTNIIQSITGFAGTLLAMPAGILLLGMEQSKAILNVMGLAASLMIVLENRRDIHKRELLRICAFMGGGILLGLLLLQVVRVDFLLIGYGIFLLAFGLFKLLTKPKKPVAHKVVLTAVLVLAGIIHGLFISGGSLLVVYAVSVLPEKKTFRATLSGVWVVLNTVLLCQHAVSGYFTGEIVLLAAVCLVPLFAAVKLGARLLRRVNQRLFLKLTYVLLLISGGLILLS